MSWYPKKSIVVPIDFSQSSFHAIRVAQELAESGKQVHLIHVIQPIHVAEPGVTWGDVSDATRIESTEKYLSDRLAEEKISGIDSTITIGSSARSIVDFAAEVKADLIVIPSHGRSGVVRFFLGSVTEKVLRMADCEVLVLRTEDAEGAS